MVCHFRECLSIVFPPCKSNCCPQSRSVIDMQGHWAVGDICIPQAHLESHHLSKGAGTPAAERTLLLTVTSRPLCLIPNSPTEQSLRREVLRCWPWRDCRRTDLWADDSTEVTEGARQTDSSKSRIGKNTSGKSIGGDRTGAAYQRFHGCP